MARWENQALRAPRVKRGKLDTKESQDSLAKLAVQEREALQGNLVNQALQAAPGRGGPTANQDPEDLLERPDLMENKGLRAGLVQKGNRVPLENWG